MNQMRELNGVNPILQIDEQLMYAYWLNSIPLVGNKTLNTLMNHFQSPKDVYMASQEELKTDLTEQQLDRLQRHRSYWNLENKYLDLQRQGIKVVWKGDGKYPERLRKIADSPFLLYYKGNLPGNDVPSVAIIGARACSSYGKKTAELFGKRLAERGVNIISGFAYGIDSMGQKGAFQADGRTFAVLGNGVDICYPKENVELFQSIQKQGGILSEYAPGTQPMPSLFPARNRIISGLADLVLVVEARRRSGTYITVTQALEQGKEVYAVPGRITDVPSEGCNFLISQGAGIALSPEDILMELEQKCPCSEEVIATNYEDKRVNEENDTVLWNILDDNPKSLQTIWEEYNATEKISVQELSMKLVKNLVGGKIDEVCGYYVKK